MNNIKSLLKIIFKIFRFSFLSIKIILNFIFKVIDKVIESIVTRLRFSITFKLTVTYILTFIIIFFLMTIGILGSFRYYIKNDINENYLSILTVILVTCNIMGLIAIVIIGSKASKRLLSPIETMTKTVKKISINVLDKRLDIRGSKDELKDLAKTFNDMLDRLQISVEQQNRFVSDASHELRTPISVIQGYVNLLDRWGKNDKAVLEESIEAIKSEAEDMKDLVEKLLFLARGDKNTQKIEKQTFILKEVIDEILKETRLIDKTHDIKNEYNEEFMIKADRKLIKEAIRIFMDNSIKYTPVGGTIKLNSYLKNNDSIITIEDTGIGISSEDIPNIFNRFYRADKSRTKKSGGTGLGLAIAKWIIDNHNGKIHLWSKEDIGTAIRITLPIN